MLIYILIFLKGRFELYKIMISNIDELYRDGFNDLRYKMFTMNQKKVR